jgi:hypothetical protein
MNGIRVQADAAWVVLITEIAAQPSDCDERLRLAGGQLRPKLAQAGV